MKKIKVLIVEDSLMFRQILVRNLITDPMLEVVAQASDPYEARDAILKYEPDVMTLDIELPRMDGIEFLRKLMPQYPLPTVVISALSDRVFDAMSAGAVEFVNKPSGMTADCRIYQGRTDYKDKNCIYGTGWKTKTGRKLQFQAEWV